MYIIQYQTGFMIRGLRASEETPLITADTISQDFVSAENDEAEQVDEEFSIQVEAEKEITNDAKDVYEVHEVNEAASYVTITVK